MSVIANKVFCHSICLPGHHTLVLCRNGWMYHLSASSLPCPWTVARLRRMLRCFGQSLHLLRMRSSLSKISWSRLVVSR